MEVVVLTSGGRGGPPRTRWTRIEDVIPDVRDGLTRPERIVLWVLSETQRERGGRNVPTAMLYGRVIEHIDMSEADLYDILNRLGAGSKDVPTPKP